MTSNLKKNITMATLDGPWLEHPDHRLWDSTEVTRKILGESVEGRRQAIPVEWARICATRLREMRDELRGRWVGLFEQDIGWLLDWLLAALIARENVLLLGAPGVAKTEISVSMFELLGLDVAHRDENLLKESLANATSIEHWWLEREKREAHQHKYFRYLLSRFTQPEELFGPIEIELLRKGILARVNFGFLTGPGVRAAFLDEVFKASSSILNTLLTLIYERQFFNWGGMVKSDLVMLIGASNELPGGFGAGAWGIGSGGDDFQTLYAFLDRFPVRLLVPPASGTSVPEPEKSDLAEATKIAIKREASRFSTGAAFASRNANMPVINDILLLGRCLMQHEADLPSFFAEDKLIDFKKRFFEIAAELQHSGTSPESGTITWTISPRKLKSLYKVALAHALVRDDNFAHDPNASIIPVETREDLRIFHFIWDSPIARSDLASRVNVRIRR